MHKWIEQGFGGPTVVRIRHGIGPAVIAVGVLGGLVGAVYVGALHLLGKVLGPEHNSSPVQLAILVSTGAAVALITHFLGETGNVELLVDNIHVLGGAEDVRALRPLIPASLLCVASGAGMGPEAPLVQSTGTLGTVIGTRLGRSPVDVRILTITGMAAGFTVLFGAPLGSAIFALEILHRRGLQYYEALLPAIIGSLCGYAPELDVDALSGHLEALEAARFIAVDWDTDEAVIRTFVRHDGVLQNQNLGKGMWSAWIAVESPHLRRVVLDNLPEVAFEERFRPPELALRDRGSNGSSDGSSNAGRDGGSNYHNHNHILQPASAERSIDRFVDVPVDNQGPTVRLAQ